MTVPGLGIALDAWNSGDIESTSKQKNNMRRKRRSGFRTFLRETIGDFSIALAMLRHGYSSPEALLNLGYEVFQARQTARAEREKQTHVVTRKSHPELAKAARKARQEYAKGKKLAYMVDDKSKIYDDLNWWEKELHQRFHTGRLKREMIEANKEFGNGIGVEKMLSVEQLALLELSFKN